MYMYIYIYTYIYIYIAWSRTKEMSALHGVTCTAFGSNRSQSALTKPLPRKEKTSFSKLRSRKMGPDPGALNL